MQSPALATGLLTALLCSASLPACVADDLVALPYQSPCTEATFPGHPLGSRCGRLVDPEGRVVALRGVNARIAGVFDVVWDPTQPPLMPLTTFDAGDAAAIRAFGFDALRLPLNWSGVEPTADGGFDEAYLDRVAQVVRTCGDAGVRVLLDLHQDAYSKELGGDGAPLWAIEPPPTMLGPAPAGVNPTTSNQTIAAFDTFFGDSAQGATLRARFIAMATHVAARFAGDPDVIGLEIYNEPPPDIMTLEGFYQAAFAAVRPVIPQQLFAFEPSAFRNVVDYAPLGAGSLGPGTAYAPHIYTFVFSGATDAERAAMSKEDLRPSNESAAEEAASWDAPPLVTEWGYDPMGPKAPELFTWQSELQEEYALSSFLWVWKELPPADWGCFDYDSSTSTFSERAWMKKAIARVRPAAVAGWPAGYAFDRASGEFTLAFLSDPAVLDPHLIAVAPVLGTPVSVTCDGAPATYAAADTWGTLAVQCGQGDGAHHRLAVSVAPLP
jgi:endoglycosylceramidase